MTLSSLYSDDTCDMKVYTIITGDLLQSESRKKLDEHIRLLSDVISYALVFVFMIHT
jgi:hypothetical protein